MKKKNIIIAVMVIIAIITVSGIAIIIYTKIRKYKDIK